MNIIFLLIAFSLIVLGGLWMWLVTYKAWNDGLLYLSLFPFIIGFFALFPFSMAGELGKTTSYEATNIVYANTWNHYYVEVEFIRNNRVEQHVFEYTPLKTNRKFKLTVLEKRNAWGAFLRYQLNSTLDETSKIE